jgi:glycosyltransferase involved in cell wall biosynthesis
MAPIDEYIEYKELYPQVEHIGIRSLKRDSTNPFLDIMLCAELYHKYKRIAPDLIMHYTHKPNIFGSITAKILGIKSVSVITGLGYSFINAGWVNTVIKKLYQYSTKANELLIFENEDDRDLFIKELDLPLSKAKTVKGCGVDSQYYVSQPNGALHSHVTFTFIGRLLKDKGVEEFAEAAIQVKRQHHTAKFILLGDFDEGNPSTIDKESLLTWINKDIVDYKGFVKDVRPYIQSSDCIVLPSYREGLPRIVIEGMSMSKPIITTDTPGCRETVEDGINGYLVSPRNSKSLAEGMLKFINLNAEEKRKMGEAGRKIVELQFDSEKIADDIYKLIEPII